MFFALNSGKNITKALPSCNLFSNSEGASHKGWDVRPSHHHFFVRLKTRSNFVPWRLFRSIPQTTHPILIT